MSSEIIPKLVAHRWTKTNFTSTFFGGKPQSSESRFHASATERWARSSPQIKAADGNIPEGGTGIWMGALPPGRAISSLKVFVEIHLHNNSKSILEAPNRYCWLLLGWELCAQRLENRSFVGMVLSIKAELDPLSILLSHSGTSKVGGSSAGQICRWNLFQDPRFLLFHFPRLCMRLPKVMFKTDDWHCIQRFNNIWVNYKNITKTPKYSKLWDKFRVFFSASGCSNVLSVSKFILAIPCCPWFSKTFRAFHTDCSDHSLCIFPGVPFHAVNATLLICT